MDNPTVTINVFAAIGGILAAFLTGGGLTLVALNVFVGKLKSDTATLNAIEALAKSMPAETLSDVRKLVVLLKDATEIADRVTDGLPNETARPYDAMTTTTYTWKPPDSAVSKTIPIEPTGAALDG